MIIACPACMTRYVVPDTSIGAEGRTVRCAKCRHSWFQEGPSLPARPPESATRQQDDDRQASAPSSADREDPSADSASGGQDDTGQSSEAVQSDGSGADDVPASEMPPFPPAPVGLSPSLSDANGARRADIPPRFPRRRNTLRLWTWVAAIFAALALGAIVAIYAWGLPNWVPMSRPTFAAAQPELQLDFPLEQQERRQLPNGTEYFGASGTVTNTGSVSHAVPPILIVLRDEQERIVYSWEVVPPQRTLAPGETMAINEAVTDVPRSARVAEIGWKPD